MKIPSAEDVSAHTGFSIRAVCEAFRSGVLRARLTHPYPFHWYPVIIRGPLGVYVAVLTPKELRILEEHYRG